MTLDDVLEAARQLHQSHPELQAFGPWPTDLTPTGLQPRPIPATELVRDFELEGTNRTQALVDAVRATAHFANWKRTYTEEEVGPDFRNRYGYYELMGPTGHFHTNQMRGFIGYWGAGLNYDWHCHEAEELYLNLAGSAVFRVEGDDVLVLPHQTRAHGSWQSHAMITSNQPILNLILWRGEGIAGLPRMDVA